MDEHAFDCTCADCHGSRHGLWASVVPTYVPATNPSTVRW